MTTHFTDAELTPMRNGIRTFIRLTGFIHDDFQYRWFADEQDAISALKSIVRAFQLSERMMGKPKYQGQPFDAVRQVREDTAAWMLTGSTESDTAANRKRYGPLYYLVIEPAINLFAKFDHETMMLIVEDNVNHFISMVEECDAYGTLDDALVAQAMTRTLIQQREAAVKLEKLSRKKANRKKKKDDDSDFVGDDSVTTEEEEATDGQ